MNHPNAHGASAAVLVYRELLARRCGGERLTGGRDSAAGTADSRELFQEKWPNLSGLRAIFVGMYFILILPVALMIFTQGWRNRGDRSPLAGQRSISGGDRGDPMH